jgi:hypothetical protein
MEDNGITIAYLKLGRAEVSIFKALTAALLDELDAADINSTNTVSLTNDIQLSCLQMQL